MTSPWGTSIICCCRLSRWKPISFRAVKAMVPSVKAVRIPAPFTVYVSIEKKTEGQGKNAILAVLGADLYMKHVIVVDHDIDIFNDQRVQWAVGTRCQADRDVLIISNVGLRSRSFGFERRSDRQDGESTPRRNLAWIVSLRGIAFPRMSSIGWT